MSNLQRRLMARSPVQFLWPQVETIEDFAEYAWTPGNPLPSTIEPYRGSREIPADRDFYLLDCATNLHVRAFKSVGRAVKYLCDNQKIGEYRVIKGLWPDPFALLMAHDINHISPVYISLIDYDHYTQWITDHENK